MRSHPTLAAVLLVLGATAVVVGLSVMSTFL
jgi:hypothetical protein